MAKTSKTIKSFDELPIVMKVQDFMDATGLSKVTAYECVNRKDFPKIRVGKRILIPKEGFICWIRDNMGDVFREEVLNDG